MAYATATAVVILVLQGRASQQQLTGSTRNHDVHSSHATHIATLAGTGSQLHTIKLAKGVALGKVPQVGCSCYESKEVLGAACVAGLSYAVQAYTKSVTSNLTCWLLCLLLAVVGTVEAICC